MKTSKFFLSTQKESPAEAEVVSHRLMLRAGIIRRVAAGIYTWLPLGLRVVQKVAGIIREEMNRAGAVELAMPVVQPGELWQESGRWQAYGPELLRFRDRHERDFVLQPTSEEAITEFARAELKSYRRLPVHFYQVQTKFRDERPGVLFADMELIGIPHRVVLSERGWTAGTAEYKGRRDDQPQDVKLDTVADFLRQRLA